MPRRKTPPIDHSLCPRCGARLGFQSQILRCPKCGCAPVPGWADRRVYNYPEVHHDRALGSIDRTDENRKRATGDMPGKQNVDLTTRIKDDG